VRTLRVTGFGHAPYGAAVAGLGLLNLAYGWFSPIAGSPPAWLPWPRVWVDGSGMMLLAASAGLFFGRSAATSALAIGGYELLCALARAPPLMRDPLAIGSWYGFAEALGPLLGAWILYAAVRRRSDASLAAVMGGERAQRLARALFGAACVVYGAAHFAYAQYTASLIPTCLPARTALAYLTGAAHAAAGLGLLAGVLPRMAAMLEALMITLFGVLVWLPSFFTQPIPRWAAPAQNQWSETVVTILLAASAWIVAASLRHEVTAGRPVPRH